MIEPQSPSSEQSPVIVEQSPAPETKAPVPPLMQEDKTLTAPEQPTEKAPVATTEQPPTSSTVENPTVQQKPPPSQSTASLTPPTSQAPRTPPPATKPQPVATPQRKPAPRGAAHTETQDRRAAHASNANNQAAAPAQTRAGVSAAEIDAYKSEIVARINAAKHYPEEARSRGARGVAVVSFSISASGALGGASLQRTSGDSTLDGDAVATVRRAAPFPAPPAGATRAFSVALNYRP